MFLFGSLEHQTIWNGQCLVENASSQRCSSLEVGPSVTSMNKATSGKALFAIFFSQGTTTLSGIDRDLTDVSQNA